MTSPEDRHKIIFEVFFGAEDGRGPDPRDNRFGACMRCWALQRGKTSAEDVALAEDALGPHVCEADPRKIIVWIAKDSAGEIRSGIDVRQGSPCWAHALRCRRLRPVA